MTKKVVAIIGALDTKGAEYAFSSNRSRVRASEP